MMRPEARGKRGTRMAKIIVMMRFPGEIVDEMVPMEKKGIGKRNEKNAGCDFNPARSNATPCV
jgi:hypothetical protein